MDSFAFNLSPLKLEEHWDFLFYVCSDLGGRSTEGQFCSEHHLSRSCPQDDGGGWDIAQKSRCPAEYQYFLIHVSLSIVLRQPSLLTVPGDASLSWTPGAGDHGLGPIIGFLTCLNQAERKMESFIQPGGASSVPASECRCSSDPVPSPQGCHLDRQCQQPTTEASLKCP